MADIFEMFINGRKFELPFNMEGLFSQLRDPVINRQFTEDLQKQNREIDQLLAEESRKITPLPLQPKYHFESHVTNYKDLPLREAVINMNKRIIKIEELLKLRTKAPITKTKVISKTKESSKAKEIPKGKPKVKEKPKNSKVTKKKIGKKK